MHPTSGQFYSKSFDDAYSRLMHIEHEVFEDMEVLIHFGERIITSFTIFLTNIYGFCSQRCGADASLGMTLNLSGPTPGRVVVICQDMKN
jgi:hypothetical protein